MSAVNCHNVGGIGLVIYMCVQFWFLETNKTKINLYHNKKMFDWLDFNLPNFLQKSLFFNILIQNAEKQGLLHGCRVGRGAPSISHLLFSNDAFLFGRPSVDEVEL